MPKVGNKSYSYTPKGMAQAKKASKDTGMPMKSKDMPMKAKDMMMKPPPGMGPKMMDKKAKKKY